MSAGMLHAPADYSDNSVRVIHKEKGDLGHNQDRQARVHKGRSFGGQNVTAEILHCK